MGAAAQGRDAAADGGDPERPAPDGAAGGGGRRHQRRPAAAPSDRARAGLRVPHPHPGRAHHEPHRRRDRAPVLGPRPVAQPRRHLDLRLAQAGGSLPPLRPHHGAARRTAHRDLRQEPDQPARDRAGHGRPRSRAGRAAGGARHGWGAPAGGVGPHPPALVRGRLAERARRRDRGPFRPGRVGPLGAPRDAVRLAATRPRRSLPGRPAGPVRIAGGGGARGSGPRPRGAAPARPVLQLERARQPVAAGRERGWPLAA